MTTTKDDTSKTTSKSADKPADEVQGQSVAIQHPDGEDTVATFEVPDPADYELGEAEVVAPFEGGWVRLKAGTNNAGRVGSWVETLESDDEGPITILVRTRDAENMLLTVDYADVERPVDYYGGR